MIQASAPGKVVLSGEYAVLDGAPAVAMAVNRRARVAVEADGKSNLRCTGLAGGVDRRMLDCALKVCDVADAEHLSFELDTHAFVDEATGDKLGIGSSAALSVALVQVLAPDASVERVRHMAAEAHQHFQGGVGSGIDIAAAATGGLIGYRQDASSVSTLRWPDGLLYALLWSGVPANTRDRLRHLDKVEERPSRRALFAAAEAAAAAWQEGSGSDVIEYGRQYAARLLEFSDEHELGIFESGHASLLEKAVARDLLYKPCGAGGGDIGIALATSQTVLDEFVRTADASGFAAMAMRMDLDGVRIDE